MFYLSPTRSSLSIVENELERKSRKIFFKAHFTEKKSHPLEFKKVREREGGRVRLETAGMKIVRNEERRMDDLEWKRGMKTKLIYEKIPHMQMVAASTQTHE